MNLHKVKLFFGLLVLLAFANMAVFSLISASHSAAMPMANCPYTQGGYSVCESTLNHIDKWQKFLGITVPALYVFLLLALGAVSYFLGQNFLNQKQYFYRWKYYLYSKKLHIYPNRIIKWLSLLENSPSLIGVRV